MIQELKQLIFEQCVFRYDEVETYRVEGLHVIAGQRLDVLIEIKHTSEGHSTVPNSLEHEPEFIETHTELEITECGIFDSDGEQVEINVQELQNEINR